MLDKKDVQWWVLEAQKHPESATDLIRMLADRLVLLDKQNEELRGELIALRRNQRNQNADGDVTTLRQRIIELETALSKGRAELNVLVYGPDRIEVKAPFDDALKDGAAYGLA